MGRRSRRRRRRGDPRRDLARGTVALANGEIAFVHPREAMDVLYEEIGAEQEFPPYWAELWPAGIELAREVSRHDLDGMGVLELGCGLGLPSIAAGLAGARVLATDRAVEAIEFTTANARRNRAVVEVALSGWEQPDVMVDRAPWDLVLGADLLYEQRNVSWLLALLPRLVDDDGEVWIADPRRSRAEEFLAAAARDWYVATSTTRIPTVSMHRLRRR